MSEHNGGRSSEDSFDPVVVESDHNLLLSDSLGLRVSCIDKRASCKDAHVLWESIVFVNAPFLLLVQ